jgi:homoserine O-acetyltransferase
MPDPLNRRTGIAALASAAEPFPLDCGGSLAALDLAYESYGTLDADGGNAILVCHALTGSAHAAGLDEQGRRGWWDGAIGSGRGIDTDRWFVICSNVLGSCYGSTGPGAIDPATGVPYGSAFPAITIRDMVRAQRRLVEHLGIERLHAVVGGSMGGMQVLEWALLHPELVGRIAPIATSARHSAWGIAFNAIAREALQLGIEAGSPEAGLRLARKVAMMTYRSELELEERFGRARTSGSSFAEGFQVESYLEHHGRRLVERFDAESYETITRAMDMHDVTIGRGDLAATLGSIAIPSLSVGISSDVLYPPREQRAIAELIPNGIYAEIGSPCGHDAFLIEYDQLNILLGSFLSASLRATAEAAVDEAAVDDEELQPA